MALAGGASQGHGTGWFLVMVVLLGLTLAGEPAPAAISAVEAVLVVLVGLVILAGVAIARHRGGALLSVTHRSILVVTAVYCLSVLLTVGVGVARGATLAAAVRATAPYLLFLPLVAIGPWLSRGSAGPAVRALVVAGVAHTGFLLALFATGVQDVLDLRTVFLGRTTLLDARTTVPLFLASAILPLAWVAHGPPRRRLIALVIIGASCAGALSTQTRSQLLALAAGAGVFLLGYGASWARQHARPPAVALRRTAGAALVLALAGAVTVATVPPLRVLAGAVALRTAADQDNGRVANEWIPAVQAATAAPAGLLVGIGAGESFLTAEGEPRTYVHNLAIYTLVFGGIIGLLGTALFHLGVGVALVRRARREAALEVAALLALFVALLVYAQFFAVHKLLSYNLMLALVAQAAVAARGRVPEAA